MMIKHRKHVWKILSALIVFWIINSNAIGQEDSQQARSSLKAMSFNIRLGVANDGANHWEKRKEIVVQTIKNYDADFVGTQETWDFQAKYISENLPGFSYAGRSRQNDNRGEQCGIFYRTSRFDKLIEGHFWLSQTPDRPGSKSWDSSLPRMATWLKLWDRTNEKSFYVINTHFDHRGKTARTESAKQIRKFIESLPEGSQVIVTGDFNAGENSNPYNAMFKKSESSQSPVVDSFRITHPESDIKEGTFNGFTGKDEGARIDWIAATRSFEILSAEIDRTSFEDRFPSDHFPVVAEVKFKDE